MKTYYFWLFVLIDVFCRAWHQTSKFDQELLYETRAYFTGKYIIETIG